LSGDADEELRMKDRVQEKAFNAKQGNSRVTINDIRSSQRNPKADSDLLIKEDELEFVKPNRTTSKESEGRKRSGLSVVSSNHAKFDVTKNK